jgi:hypothetical protein
MAAAFLAACSSSTSSSAPASGSPAAASAATSSAAPSSAAASGSAGASKAAICTTASNLKASVQDLKNVDVKANGLSAVSAQFTKIKQEFQTFKTDAKGQYSTQVSAMQDALNHLSTSLDAAKANTNAGTLGTVAVYVKLVVTTGNDLVTAVTSTC